MANIRIIQPGLFTSIQDLGRFGFQKYGVPQAGVMDRYAMRICNLILGNPEDTAVMEITFQGPHLRFDSPTSICITGADLSPVLNNKAISNNEIIKLEAGDEIRFGNARSGLRTYLGIRGGFETESLMGSQSWYEGLTENFRFKKDMELGFDSRQPRDLEPFSSLKIDEDYISQTAIEAYPGPEFEFLNEEQQQKLFLGAFSIESNSNRMAIQLSETFNNELDPITTGPVLPGTVQLTPSGKLMILMRDCQTTGGYPRVLQLSEFGIQVLAQKAPGAKISFEKKLYRKD